VGASSPKVTAQISSSGAGGNPSLGSATGITYITTSNTAFGMQLGVNGSTGVGWIQQGRTDATATAYNLLLNPLGGNVGIGTSAPTGTLHVNSSALNTPLLKLAYTGNSNNTGNILIPIEVAQNTTAGGAVAVTTIKVTDTSTGGPFPSTKTLTGLHVDVSGSTYGIKNAAIFEGGNVGIGNSSPGHRLSLADSISTVYSPTGLPSPIVGVANTDTTVGAASLQIFTVAGAGGTSVIYHGAVGGGGSATGQYVIGRRTGTSTYAESLRIDSAGRLGIGTTSPSANGLVTIAETTNARLYLTDSTLGNTYGAQLRGYGLSGQGAYAELGVVDTNTYNRAITVTAQANQIVFGKGATEKARIDSSSRLLVGTSSAFNSGSTIEAAGSSGGVVTLTNTNTNITGANSVFGQINFYTADISSGNPFSSGSGCSHQLGPVTFDTKRRATGLLNRLHHTFTFLLLKPCLLPPPPPGAFPKWNVKLLTELC
jgi:hypothetical protein